MILEYARKLNKDVIGIDSDVIELMEHYAWPGNIRELQNVIEYSVNMSSTPKITRNVIPNRVNNIESEEIVVNDDNIRTLEELEKREILKALNKYKNYKKDKELVAKSLGISRATLYRKLEKYNIISKWDWISFWDFFVLFWEKNENVIMKNIYL